METGNKIPLRVIADAIYPSGEGAEETVRKTTAPPCQFSDSNSNLSLLVAQVADESITHEMQKNEQVK